MLSHLGDLLLLLGSTATISASYTPTLFWHSTGGPGDTLILGKSGPCDLPCDVYVAPASGAASVKLAADAVHVNNHSVMIELPSTLPLDAYNITVGGSTPFLVGAPDLWW